MTDTPPSANPVAAPSSGRGLKIALALSVALNLAVAGMVVGAWVSGHGPGGGMPRDLSFGPFSEAMSPEDRRAIRKAFLDRAPNFRESRAEARAEFATLLTALRADPFDQTAMTAALATIESRNADRLELGRSLIETRILQMSATDRLAFADRLEGTLGGMRDGD